MGGAVGWFALNFFLVLTLGVGTLYWIGYHTEWLGIVGGVLGLGGAFAWVAFVLGLVRKERKEAMQFALDGALSSRWTAACAVLAAVVLAIVGSMYGSIRIDARRDSSERYVEILLQRDDERELVHSDLLPAHSVRTFPVRAGDGARPYELRIIGLPELELRARSFERTTIRSPDALLARSVLVLRPTTEVTQTIRRDAARFELTVRIGEDPPARIENYRGESVWVGCEESVVIPPALRDRWRMELAAARLPEALMLPWLAPSALATRRELLPGERVRITLGRPGHPWFSTEAVVQECRQAACFPQEVVLDAP
jgi:hypothetical protein